jgi:hypothetical protein
MKTLTKIFAGTAGLAALAAAAPAAAQIYGNPYGYSNPYGYAYGNPYGYANTNVATQQCMAAVQNRLHTRQGVGGVIGALLGAPMAQPRVVSVTQVVPRRSTVTVRGLASTGRMAYNPYTAYGALGAGYQPDLSFRCTVDHRGYVRDVDIFRR